jgi:hypothetical protein
MTLKSWKDYTYFPLHLDPVKEGFKHGQKYPNNPIFGNLQGKQHLGQDYICPINTKVYSLADGYLSMSRNPQSGLMASILTTRGLNIRIMHLHDIYVHEGMVKKGQLIAISGNSGLSTTPHTHIDIFEGKKTDPNKFNKFIDPLTLTYSTDINNKEEDMTTQEVRSIVESLYWKIALREPDKSGVDYWVGEYFKEKTKTIWMGRIIEGFNVEKENQGLRFYDAKNRRWRTEQDVKGN